MAAAEANHEAVVQEILERTGGTVLLDALGEVYESERTHSIRVAGMAMHIMLMLGGTEQDVVKAGYEGVLHDVGKVNPTIQDIIKSPSKLSPQKKVEIAQAHTILGATLIGGLKVEDEDADLCKGAAATAFFHHHSPRKLMKLRFTSPSVRIIQIADQFDAMQDTRRPYHYGNAYSAEEAAAEIRADLQLIGACDMLAQSTLGLLIENYS